MATGHYRKTYFSVAKSDAEKRDLDWTISFDDYASLTEQSCSYCGTSGPVGLDRQDTSIGYTVENVKPVCWVCNRARNVLSEEEFFDWVARVYEHSVTTSTI